MAHKEKPKPTPYRLLLLQSTKKEMDIKTLGIMVQCAPLRFERPDNVQRQRKTLSETQEEDDLMARYPLYQSVSIMKVTIYIDHDVQWLIISKACEASRKQLPNPLYQTHYITCNVTITETYVILRFGNRDLNVQMFC